jgi:RND family efflux transporter MFP subunit
MSRKTLDVLVFVFCLLFLAGQTVLAGQELMINDELQSRFWPAVSLARQRATLASNLEEDIESVEVQEGDRVSKGDLLLKFDSGEIDARIDVARVQAELETLIQMARENYEFRKREYQRSKKLAEGESVISASELDKDKNEMIQAMLQVEEYERQKRLAQKKLAQYQAEAQDYYIRSPINGVVSRVWVENGEMGTIGKQLLEVINPDVLEVRVHLPERFLPAVGLNQKVTVRFPPAAGQQAAGHICFVSPYVDSGSGTFLVEILTEPKSDIIIPGMSCEVKFGYVDAKNRIKHEGHE